MDLSLSKLLLQSRGGEAIRKVAIVNAFTRDGTASLPVTLTPEKDPEDAHEMVMTGTETLTTVCFKIAMNIFKWDGCEIYATPPQSAMLSGGVASEAGNVQIKSTGMLNLLVETVLAREEVRRLDVLEASLESIRSLLLCQRAELHLQGAC